MKGIGCITVCVLTLLLALYFFMFNDKLSVNSDDWGNFGSYIGGVGSLVLSVAVFFYTHTLNQKTEKEKQDENIKDKQIQLLKQIQILLSKIEQYNSLSSKISGASIEERGEKSFSKMIEDIGILEIEIRTSFAISVSLAKGCNMQDVPQDGNVKISEIKIYAEKWLKWYEESNK